MNRIKKIATVILFLSLITSFVIYRADVFKFEIKEDTSKLIVSNFIVKQDSLDKDSRLLIDYVFHLNINRTKLTVEKWVVKIFTLETWDNQLISSSKSIIVQKSSERPKYATENENIIKELNGFNIKRVRFTTNKYFDGTANDDDLLEVIELVKNETLKSNSSLEQHITNKNRVDLYWKQFKSYKVEVNDFDNPKGVLVDSEKVDKFLKWYDEKTIADEKRNFEIMASSKSIIVADIVISDVPELKQTPEYLEKRKLFKEKIKKHLGIEF